VSLFINGVAGVGSISKKEKKTRIKRTEKGEKLGSGHIEVVITFGQHAVTLVRVRGG